MDAGASPLLPEAVETQPRNVKLLSMTLNIEEIARAFSGHRFDEAADYVADDVTLALVGAEPLTGKDAVLEATAATTRDLADARIDFRQFDTIVGSDAVVIDAVASYTEANGNVSTVASCDIYRFANGMIASVRSYNIELPAD